MLFQTTFEKNPVAKTGKKLVFFFCRSARFAVLQLLFSGSAEVAAGLSNENQATEKVEEESRAIRL